jgi:hypothetical protein
MSEPSSTRPPTSPPAARPAAPSFDEEDRTFVAAMRDAGLCSELEDAELERVIAYIGSRRGLGRRVDMLEAYYSANGDGEVARRRIASDGFFLQREDEPINAHGLVKRFSRLVPDLRRVVIERIGTDDGPIVLRAGEHVAAVVDDYEEDLETGEIDLREIDEGPPTISVLGVVRALNVLMQKHSIRYRFVPLASDQAREVYVTTTVAEAMTLANGGYLDLDDAEQLLDLASW